MTLMTREQVNHATAPRSQSKTTKTQPINISINVNYLTNEINNFRKIHKPCHLINGWLVAAFFLQCQWAPTSLVI